MSALPGLFDASTRFSNPDKRDGVLSPTALAAEAGMQHAVEFQMWVSQQATSLAKLKIFATMAKNINDQQ